MIELKVLFNQLVKTPLPQFTDNEKLDNLIEDLIETDAYYAGLASSVINGGKIHKNELIKIPQLTPKFFTSNYTTDTNDVQNYIELLNKIRNCLFDIAL